MSKENNLYKPLGINPWAKQYSVGVSEIGSLEDDPIFDYEKYDGRSADLYKEIAITALYNELAYRTSRNQSDHLAIEFNSEEERERFETGDISPSEGLKLLKEHPHMRSIELARLRHVGDWYGSDKIVESVSRNIESDEELMVNTVDVSADSPSYYRITGFSVADPELQDVLAVTRKREILTHYDDSLVTILAETYALDVSSESIDPETQKKIIAEFKRLEDIKHTAPSEIDEWNESHHNFVGEAIDLVAQSRRDTSDDSSVLDEVNINGALPLTSAVYAATREARRDYDGRASSVDYSI